jgi:hypothetical protein
MLRSSRPDLRRGARNSALRGALGDAGTGDFLTFLGDNPDLAAQVDTYQSQNPGDPITGAAQMPATGPNPGWSGFLTNIVNDATAIAAPLIRQATAPRPYYITNPAGQSVLYNPATGGVSNPTSIGSALNPTAVLLGLGVLVVVLVAGKKS